MNVTEILDRILLGFRASKYVYCTDQSIESVRGKLASIVNRKMLCLVAVKAGDKENFEPLLAFARS